MIQTLHSLGIRRLVIDVTSDIRTTTFAAMKDAEHAVERAVTVTLRHLVLHVHYS